MLPVLLMLVLLWSARQGWATAEEGHRAALGSGEGEGRNQARQGTAPHRRRAVEASCRTCPLLAVRSHKDPTELPKTVLSHIDQMQEANPASVPMRLDHAMHPDVCKGSLGVRGGRNQ